MKLLISFRVFICKMVLTFLCISLIPTLGHSAPSKANEANASQADVESTTSEYYLGIEWGLMNYGAAIGLNYDKNLSLELGFNRAFTDTCIHHCPKSQRLVSSLYSARGLYYLGKSFFVLGGLGLQNAEYTQYEKGNTVYQEKLFTFGAELSIGNRWTRNRLFYWGFDWFHYYLPIIERSIKAEGTKNQSAPGTSDYRLITIQFGLNF